MVVIEPQDEDNQPTLTNNQPRPEQSPSSETTPDSSKVTGTVIPPPPPTSTAVHGHDSDGFETASEHGLSDNEAPAEVVNSESDRFDAELKQVCQS